jgi:hypothetical protein
MANQSYKINTTALFSDPKDPLNLLKSTQPQMTIFKRSAKESWVSQWFRESGMLEKDGLKAKA